MSVESPEPAAPRLSVVVVGRNEGDRLVRCLESVSGMTPLQGDFEILYVDSGSVDESPDRAREAGARIVTVEGKSSAAVARNAGWRAARGEFVLFLDGAPVLDSDFPARALGVFEDEKVALVRGARRDEKEEPTMYDTALAIDDLPPPDDFELCWGEAMVRRSVLEQTNGFDVRLMAGEWPDLCRKIRELGLSLRNVADPMVVREGEPIGFGRYWKRLRRQGYGLAEASALCRTPPLPAWAVEARRIRPIGAVALLSVPGAIALSGLTRSFLPIGLLVGIFLIAALVAAIRAGGKGDGMSARFFFGLHAAFRPIPVFLGQLDFYRDATRDHRRGPVSE